MKKILVFLVILALLGLGSFFVAGNMARDKYMNFLTENAKGALTLANTRYERGLFVSKATTRIVLADPKKAVGEEHAIVLEHIFRHGPLPLETGEEQLRPALAQTETFLADAANQPAAVREILEKAPALAQAKCTMWFGFTGEIDGVANVPAISASDAETSSSFEMGASTLRFQYERSKQSLVGNWDFPGFQAQGPGGTAALKNLQCTFDLVEKLPWVYVGDTNLELARFEVATKKSVSLDGLRMSSKSGIENSLLSDQQKASLDTLRVGEETYGPIVFNADVRNVNAQAMSDFQGRMREVWRNGGEDETLPQIQALMTSLLAGNPEFHADFSLRADAGDLDGNFKVRLTGSGAVLNPLVLLKRLEAEGEVSAQETLIRHFAARTMSNELEGEENATRLDQMYEAQIEPLVKQSMIVRDGERLKSKATLKQGKLNVNGKEIPLS